MNKEVRNKNKINRVFIAIGNFFISNSAFFKRLGMALITLICAMIFGFICIKLMPGDVIKNYALKIANTKKIPYEDAYRQAVNMLNYDPNESIFSQLFRYIGGVFKGDFGTSMYRDDVTVLSIIRDFLPWTLFISGVALVISFVFGVLLGGKMAVKRKGFSSAVASTYIVVSGAIPDYLFGLILIVIFSVKLRIFPIEGNYDLIMELEGMNPVINVLYHAFLPILSYSFVQIGSWALFMRSSAIGVLGEDYIYAARVRGLSEKVIRSRYIMRNAMLPLITTFAVSFGAIFGGAPLMESIFNYPGFGLQFNIAIGDRDYFIIQGMMVFMSFMIILANLIADSLYTLIDPRIRKEQ